MIIFNKYDRKQSIQFVYCYDGTDVYKNKFQIMDSKRLSEVEFDLASNRLIEMSRNPVKGRFGIARFFISMIIYNYIDGEVS